MIPERTTQILLILQMDLEPQTAGEWERKSGFTVLEENTQDYQLPYHTTDILALSTGSIFQVDYQLGSVRAKP